MDAEEERDLAARYEAACAALQSSGTLAPLELGGIDERVWVDCDLASLAENRLGDAVDPRALHPARRADLSARALDEALWMPARRAHERCFWLLNRGERVGSVALQPPGWAGRRVRVSSLYLFPDRRHQGLGSVALRSVRSALGSERLSLRLETEWTWQTTLRFYFRERLWVRMWKRDIDMWARDGALEPIIDIGAHEATLHVDLDGVRTLLVRACRDGGRLSTFEDLLLDPVQHARSIKAEGAMEEAAAHDPRIEEVARDASTTLALALALHGWPLCESPESWERGWHGDAVNPEGLADRIVLWEAWSRKHGWRVETPRIPGLAYPTWDELEAEWAKQPSS